MLVFNVSTCGGFVRPASVGDRLGYELVENDVSWLGGGEYVRDGSALGDLRGLLLGIPVCVALETPVGT